MKIIAQLLLFSLFLSISSAIQLTLSQPQTCLDYVVERQQSKKTFYFHYNQHLGNINLVIYHKNVKSIWYETGYGIDYNTTFQLSYQQQGNYTLCFLKQAQGQTPISFQIIDEQNLSEYAGREQLAKTSKKIGEFLSSFKHLGYKFKSVLSQHNQKKLIIQNQQNHYSFLLILKTLVMIAVLFIQVLVVKKIFK